MFQSTEIPSLRYIALLLSYIIIIIIIIITLHYDRLCGLVVKSFWLQIQRSRVRFPALPDFLSSSGSGTGSTQPREVN